MKDIAELKKTIEGKLQKAQKSLTRLTDYDAGKYECAPSDDWYRLIWTTVLFAVLLIVLHGYVWVMVQGIAESKGEEVTPARIVSEAELTRAVSAQREREQAYEAILTGDIQKR